MVGQFKELKAKATAKRQAKKAKRKAAALLMVAKATKAGTT